MSRVSTLTNAIMLVMIIIVIVNTDGLEKIVPKVNLFFCNFCVFYP